jgi:hypothetical protein
MRPLLGEYAEAMLLGYAAAMLLEYAEALLLTVAVRAEGRSGTAGAPVVIVVSFDAVLDRPAARAVVLDWSAREFELATELAFPRSHGFGGDTAAAMIVVDDYCWAAMTCRCLSDWMCCVGSEVDVEVDVEGEVEEVRLEIVHREPRHAFSAAFSAASSASISEYIANTSPIHADIEHRANRFKDSIET